VFGFSEQMASPEQIELWKKIDADLRRARATLPPQADYDKSVRAYQGFHDHNELELACDTLEAYAEENPVTRDFWIALRDASVKMELHDRAMHRSGGRAASEFEVVRRGPSKLAGLFLGLRHGQLAPVQALVAEQLANERRYGYSRRPCACS
jgi:hypothetical protein